MVVATITGRFNRHADHSDLYRLLNLDSDRLPVEGMPERLIQGVRVYVKPLPPKINAHRNFQGLRVMAICACGVHVAVGRLHQHKCNASRRARKGTNAE